MNLLPSLLASAPAEVVSEIEINAVEPPVERSESPAGLTPATQTQPIPLPAFALPAITPISQAEVELESTGLAKPHPKRRLQTWVIGILAALLYLFAMFVLWGWTLISHIPWNKETITVMAVAGIGFIMAVALLAVMMYLLPTHPQRKVIASPPIKSLASSSQPGCGLWAGLVLANIIGWSLFVIIIPDLPRLTLEGMGSGTSRLLGLGMGSESFPSLLFSISMTISGAAGLGLMQWLVLQGQIRIKGWWVLATGVGLAIGYELQTPIRILFTNVFVSLLVSMQILTSIDFARSLIWVMDGLVVGTVLGLAQWFTLRRSIPKFGWWIFAVSFSYALSKGISYAIIYIISDILHKFEVRFWGIEFVNIAVIAIVSGLITATALVRLLRAAPIEIRVLKAERSSNQANWMIGLGWTGLNTLVWVGIGLFINDITGPYLDVIWKNQGENFVMMFFLWPVILGVGQWLVLRQRILLTGWWIPLTAVALMMGWLLLIITRWLWPANIFILVILEAFIIGAGLGLAQWSVLRRYVPKTEWWILASSLGFAAGIFSVFNFTGSFFYRFIPGAISGIITGATLVWLLWATPRRTDHPAPSTTQPASLPNNWSVILGLTLAWIILFFVVIPLGCGLILMAPTLYDRLIR